MSLVLTPPDRALPAQPAAPARRPGRLAAWLVRWRLALRLARRDARRAKGRTTLVLLMVGLPVLAIVAGDTLLRTKELSVVEELPARLGSADAVIQGLSRDRIYADPMLGDPLESHGEADPPWTAEEIAGQLPVGAEVVERQVGRVAYRTSIGYATVDGFADDLTRPIRDGAFTVEDGRVPAADGQVAVSSSVARRGIAVGDELGLTRDDVPLTVVGVLRSVVQGTAPFVVVAPGSADLLTNPRTEFFAAVPGGLDWPAVQELNGLGLGVVSREVAQDPPSMAEYAPPGYPADSGMQAEELAVLSLIVAALLLEVVLLVGPAFAVGLRRQRRDLALLAASGGRPGDLRRTVLASGLVLGCGAAVGGALLGLGLARVAVPVIESRTGAVLGPFEVPVLDVLVVVGVGAVAGLAAAYVPARQAARTDVVTTLTGRRGQLRTSWRMPVVGMVVAGIGLGLTALGALGDGLGVAGGAVLLVVGLVLLMPWLVGLLTPLARRFPVAGRLAVRDATRNRSRTAPAVAAVMATVTGVTALAIGSASDSAQARRDYTPQAPMGTAVISPLSAEAEGWSEVERVVAERVPGRQIRSVQEVVSSEETSQSLWPAVPGCTRGGADCSWFPTGGPGFTSTFGGLVVVDAETLAAVTPPQLREEALAAHAAGRVLVFGRGAVDEAGEVTLQATRFDRTAEQPLGSVTLPATEIAAAPSGSVLAPAMVVVPPSLVDRLPVEMATTRLLVGGPGEAVTPAEETALREAVGALTADAYVRVERGWSDDLWVVRLVLVLVGGALVLVATCTATGLAWPTHGRTSPRWRPSGRLRGRGGAWRWRPQR